MTTEWPYDNMEQSTKMLARVFVDDRQGWHLSPGFLGASKPQLMLNKIPVAWL